MSPLFQFVRKIAIARSGLLEDQQLRHPTAERRRQVARIWQLQQPGMSAVHHLRRPRVRPTSMDYYDAHTTTHYRLLIIPSR